MLEKIVVVLCNTSHAGNIGSVARAMKTMGIYRLILVNPKASHLSEEAVALASSAVDVLHGAKVVSSIQEALSDTCFSIGLSARNRDSINIHLEVDTATEIIINKIQNINNMHDIALVFGSETNGLSKEELANCSNLVSIAANPIYSSLNISHAVQIMCYEIYKKFLNISNNNQVDQNNRECITATSIQTISSNELFMLKDQFSNLILKSKYKNIYNTDSVLYKNTLLNIQYILKKIQLQSNEYDLLMGLLKHIIKQIK